MLLPLPREQDDGAGRGGGGETHLRQVFLGTPFSRMAFCSAPRARNHLRKGPRCACAYCTSVTFPLVKITFMSG